MYSYRANYLKSDHWRTKRSEALLERGTKCELCGARGNLDVHHLSYNRLYNESMYDLRVLCRECHKKAHELMRRHPKLKKQFRAKQWYILCTRIAGKKPKPSENGEMQRFGWCRDVLCSMHLIKRKRMIWKRELLGKRIKYSVPTVALNQYIKITGIDPRYRIDRVGPHRLLGRP